MWRTSPLGLTPWRSFNRGRVGWSTGRRRGRALHLMRTADLDEREPPVAFEGVTPFAWPPRHGDEPPKAW